MEPYVDYNYYKNTFMGTLIPETSFNKLERDARRKINYFTCNNIKKVNNLIKDTMCSLMELIYENENNKKLLLDNDNKIVASETNGPRSISYVNKTTIQEKQVKSEQQLNKELYNICLEYLSNTGLMYRGISSYNNNL